MLPASAVLSLESERDVEKKENPSLIKSLKFHLVSTVSHKKRLNLQGKSREVQNILKLAANQ